MINRESYKSDIKWLSYGFPLWLQTYFNSKIDVNKLGTKVENFINTPQEALAILDKYIGEAEKQQIIAYKGPVRYVLSVHCVPKKVCK